MYYTVFGNFKIRQVYTEYVANIQWKVFFRNSMAFLFRFTIKLSDFLLVSFLWYNILKSLYITEIHVYMWPPVFENILAK